LAGATTVNSRALEGDFLGLTSIPLVHLSHIVDTSTLLAGKVARLKRGAGKGVFAVWDWVLDGHVRGGTGGEGHEEGCGEKHVDIRKSDVRSRFSRLEIARPAERRKECDGCGCLGFADQVVLDIDKKSVESSSSVTHSCCKECDLPLARYAKAKETEKKFGTAVDSL
jgi:hypothetical protein